MIRLTMDESYDVIVVGAGLSGLYAGKILHEHGLRIKVLEYRNRVSGRHYTERNPEFQCVDTGGAYVGRNQTKIMQILDELGLETYKVWCGLKSILVIKGKRYIMDNGMPGGVGIFALIDLNSCFRQIDDCSKQITLGDPMAHPKAEEWDSMNFNEVIDKLCWTAGAKEFIRETFGYMLGKTSYLDILHTIKSVGGFGNFMTSGSEGGAQEMKIKNGSGQISERLTKLIQDSIRLNTCVESVDNTGKGVLVKAFDTQSRETFKYEARKLIFAIPLPQYTTIKVEPPLPSCLRILSQITPDSSIKICIRYEKQFWRDYDFGGEMMAPMDGFVLVTIDDTKPDGSFPAMMVYLTGGDPHKMSPEERKAMVVRTLADAYGLEQFLSPVAWFERNWRDEDGMATARGACTLMGQSPGVLTKAKKLPGEPIGDIHIAGSESSSTYNGYMDGALRSGERAAVQVLESFGIETDYRDETTVQVPYLEKSSIEKYLPGVPVCIGILVGVAAIVVITVIGAVVGTRYG